MADGRQPDERWSSNGGENGENGYPGHGSAYRENGFYGEAAAHPGATGERVRWSSLSVCER